MAYKNAKNQNFKPSRKKLPRGRKTSFQNEAFGYSFLCMVIVISCIKILAIVIDHFQCYLTVNTYSISMVTLIKRGNYILLYTIRIKKINIEPGDIGKGTTIKIVFLSLTDLYTSIRIVNQVISFSYLIYRYHTGKSF